MHRDLPFYALLAFETDVGLSVLGLLLICDIALGGQSRDERRQYAVKSWVEVDSNISSLGIAFAYKLGNAYEFHRSSFRFRNQVAELHRECWQLMLAAHFIDGTALSTEVSRLAPRDVPVVIAFSEQVAREAANGSLSCLVLPPGGFEALRLPRPSAFREQPDPDEDGTDDEGDGVTSSAVYPWPCPLHVMRYANRLRSADEVRDGLVDAASILFGAQEGFLVGERLKRVPSARTILAWQIKIDLIAMVFDREILFNFN